MLATLTNIKLFKGIPQKDIETLLMCLDAKKRDYKKGDYVFQEGSIIEQIGIVLSGMLIIDMLDAWGNNNVLADIGPSETFLEVYACCFKEPLMINVIAKEDTTILLLNINKIISNCPKCCAFHDTLLKNLLMLTAEMNLQLSRRILHTSSKNIRKRLLSYFSYCIKENGSFSFDIPYNRQQLADYLAVERSALSNELSKMRRDGIIQYDKNHFIVKEEMI